MVRLDSLLSSGGGRVGVSALWRVNLALDSKDMGGLGKGFFGERGEARKNAHVRSKDFVPHPCPLDFGAKSSKTPLEKRAGKGIPVSKVLNRGSGGEVYWTGWCEKCLEATQQGWPTKTKSTSPSNRQTTASLPKALGPPNTHYGPIHRPLQPKNLVFHIFTCQNTVFLGNLVEKWVCNAGGRAAPFLWSFGGWRRRAKRRAASGEQEEGERRQRHTKEHGKKEAEARAWTTMRRRIEDEG